MDKASTAAAQSAVAAVNAIEDESATVQATRLPEIMKRVAYHTIQSICIKESVGFRRVSTAWLDAFDRGLLQLHISCSDVGYCVRCAHCQFTCYNANSDLWPFRGDDDARYGFVRDVECDDYSGVIPDPAAALLSLAVNISKLSINLGLISRWQGEGRTDPACWSKITQLELAAYPQPEDATLLLLQTVMARARSLRSLNLDNFSIEHSHNLVKRAPPLHTLEITFAPSRAPPARAEIEALRAAIEGIRALACDTYTWDPGHLCYLVPSTVQDLQIWAHGRAIISFLAALTDINYLPALRRLPAIRRCDRVPTIDHKLSLLRHEVINGMRNRRGIEHLEEDLKRSEGPQVGYFPYVL